MFPYHHSFKKGAVVHCFFPLAEIPDKPGPIARPALIVSTFRDRTDQRWKAVVAYGTSQQTKANMGFEIRMSREDSLRAAGLTKPTRFTLSRMRILPIDDAFFEARDGTTPVMGHIDDVLVQRLDATLSTLASIAEPLRTLLPPRQDSSAEPELEARYLDCFMQSHLTGRSDLGGLRQVRK